MATIDVDVDPSDFSTDELLEELDSRIKKFKPEQKVKFTEMLKEWTSVKIGIYEAKSLDDQMKVDLIVENIGKVTMKQLETFFNDPDNMKTMQEVNQLREENRDLSNKVDELENKIWELE